MKPLHLPKIAALDLTFPDKFFALLESDPCDVYRAINRVNRRRAKVGLSPVASLRALERRDPPLDLMNGDDDG